MKITHSIALFIGSVSLSFSLLEGSAAHAQELARIRVGVSGTGTHQYTQELARKMGIFRKNGLDPLIVYVNSGSLLSQALIGGSFDLAASQGAEAILAKLRGADQRIVASIANRFNHVFLTVPGITSIKQLKGKKVAVSRIGSGSHFMTNLVIKEGGLEPERDIAVLQIGNSSARLAAIFARSVEGSIMTGDLIPLARREKLNLLVDLAETKLEYPFLTLNVLGSTLERNPRIVKAFIKSIAEAIRLFKTDRKAARESVRTVLRTDDPETLEFAVARTAKLLEHRPYPTPAGVQMVLEELSEREPKAKTARFEDAVDLRLLKELEREGVFQ